MLDSALAIAIRGQRLGRSASDVRRHERQQRAALDFFGQRRSPRLQIWFLPRRGIAPVNRNSSGRRS
ncbi:MAG: hypothetical protein U1F11_04365 [Steroidobacteraceae bacterium]